MAGGATSGSFDLVAQCIAAYEDQGMPAVDRLLASHPERAAEVRAQLDALLAAGLLQDGAALPDAIGPYRVLRRLGVGGMGQVYLCEQVQPVRRQVALKLIRPGLDTRQLLARFHLERQALAQLDHPHIAKVFDAGTADGRPFLVMEFIDGLPIVEFAARRGLSLRGRLELFATVCDAVHHAHRRGVLHRDLKPSNLLVREVDGQPAPAIIDFGVAKTARPGAAVSLLTQHGQMLGTPEYMSPEQAANEDDVDVRSDVFSLGVVLYEMLTGVLPISSQRLRQSTVDMVRVLREQEPLPPSQQRPSEGGFTRRELRGELDWITLRALARDRGQRYGSVQELADDVRRHLRAEPVHAGPPTLWYRTSRFVRRNRLQVGAAATVVAALSVGLVVSLQFAGRARDSAEEAAQNLDAALAAAARLVQVGSDELADLPHFAAVRQRLLQDALRFYTAFSARPSVDPRLRLQGVEALSCIGALRVQLGNHADASADYQRAAAEFDALPLPVQQTAGGRRVRAELFANHARLDLAEGRRQDGVHKLSAAAALRELVLDDPAAPPDAREGWRRALLVLARQLADAEPARALALCQRALAGDDPPDTLQVELRVLCASLAMATGDSTAAAALVDQLGAPTRELFQGAVAAHRRSEAASAARLLEDLAELEFHLERVHDAARDLELLVAWQQRRCDEQPELVGPRHGLCRTAGRLGLCNLKLGETQRAIELLQQATAIGAGVPEAGLPDQVRSDLAAFHANLAWFLVNRAQNRGASDWPGALREARRSEQLFAGLTAESQRSRSCRLNRAMALRMQAAAASALGEPEPALTALREAERHAGSVVDEAPTLRNGLRQLAETRQDLARALLARGDHAAAAAEVEQALSLQERFAALGDKEQHWYVRQRELLRMRCLCDSRLGRCDRLLEGLDAILGAADQIYFIDQWLVADTAVKVAGSAALAPELRGRVLARGVEAADAAMRIVDGMPGPATAAILRADVHQVLAELSHGREDVEAERAARRGVAEAYATALRARDNERNRSRLLGACQAWARCVQDEPVLLAAAVTQLGEWLPDEAAAVRIGAVALAEGARTADLRGAGAAAALLRERAGELLQRAHGAGLLSAALLADDALAPLFAEGWFRQLSRTVAAR